MLVVSQWHLQTQIWLGLMRAWWANLWILSRPNSNVIFSNPQCDCKVQQRCSRDKECVAVALQTLRVFFFPPFSLLMFVVNCGATLTVFLEALNRVCLYLLAVFFFFFYCRSYLEPFFPLLTLCIFNVPMITFNTFSCSIFNTWAFFLFRQHLCIYFPSVVCRRIAMQ